MAAKSKIQQPKSAGSSPAQPLKLQTLAAPPTIQPSSERQLTLEDLQGVIQKSAENLENNLEKKIITQITDLKAEFKTDLSKFQDKVEKHNTAIRQDIVEALRGIWDSALQVEERVGELEQQKEKNDEIIQDLRQADEREVMMRQYNEMSWAVRIRGFKENKQTQEDLREIFANAIAAFIGEGPNECAWQIDKIYRVNSWMAKQKNLPRDIVIYFVTRKIRNMVTTTSYSKKFVVEGQEVTILKEVPSGMLKLRRAYAFLVDELKKRGLMFRWQIPEGLTVNIQGKRYRLTSIWQAKDFYTNVLEAGNPPSPKVQKETNMGEKDMSQSKTQRTTGQEEDLMDTAAGGSICDIFQPLQMEVPQSQRQTRATTKRIEQEAKSKLKQISQEVLSIQEQAVGGARPKSSQTSIDMVLQKLAGTDHVK